MKKQNFMEAVASDRELTELLNTPLLEREDARLETLVSLGDCICVGGKNYPAHTLGTYAVLDAIDHPFLRQGAGVGFSDVLTVLYLLENREKAIPLFMRHQAQEISHEDFFEELCAASPSSSDLERIAVELSKFFEVSGGFGMLPSGGEERGGTGRAAFDAEYVSSIAAFIGGAFPALSPFDITWRVPYPMTGFLVMQVMRRNGVKGIGPRVKTDEAWKRFKTLQNQFVVRKGEK